MREKILILKRIINQFKLQGNLIRVSKKKINTKSSKEKSLKVKGIFWNMERLINDNFLICWVIFHFPSIWSSKYEIIFLIRNICLYIS